VKPEYSGAGDHCEDWPGRILDRRMTQPAAGTDQKKARAEKPLQR
jgi:hypothetical protein